uniref:Uncharacterized protein n=1 Tax=viral metagenome TaxID=1070528 RepID=A0A6M3L207_9ZZZZ
MNDRMEQALREWLRQRKMTALISTGDVSDIAAQERELTALRRVRDAAVKMRLLDDRTADSYVTGVEWSQAWNALKAALESEARE